MVQAQPEHCLPVEDHVGQGVLGGEELARRPDVERQAPDWSSGRPSPAVALGFSMAMYASRSGGAACAARGAG